MLDVTGLFVAKAASVGTGTSSSKVRGMDFREARAKGGKREMLSIPQMAFGYAEKSTGYFRRYVVRYNFDTDSVTVMTQHEDGSGNDYHSETNKEWPQKPDDA